MQSCLRTLVRNVSVSRRVISLKTDTRFGSRYYSNLAMAAQELTATHLIATDEQVKGLHMRERKVYFFLRFGGYWHISSQKGGFLPLCWWKCALFLWNGGFWALARRVFPLFWKTFSGFMVMILKSFNTWFFCSWTIKLNQTTNFIKISCPISHWKISLLLRSFLDLEGS